MVYACAVSGANILRDMREAIINTIGGHMTEVRGLLDKTIARALEVLSERAREQGYDGVLGIRISHPTSPAAPSRWSWPARASVPGQRPADHLICPGPCPWLPTTLLPPALSSALARCYKPRGRLSVYRSCVAVGSTHEGQNRETMLMALKAPGILIFTLSIILSLAVLFTRFFGCDRSAPHRRHDAVLRHVGRLSGPGARLRHARAL